MSDAYEIVQSIIDDFLPANAYGSDRLSCSIIKALRDAGKLAKPIEDQMARDMKLVNSGFEEGREFGREQFKAELFRTPTLEEVGQRFRSGALRTP